MAETQLGSMRIGSVDLFDDDEQGKGAGGGIVAPIITIADGQSDEILDDITSDFIIDDTHRRSLEDTLETYAFYTFADKPFTQHLKDRNRIIIPDEDGTLREFIIYESEKYRDTEGYKMYVIGTASYLDLKKANVIYPTRRNNQTASMMVGFATNNTEWRAGIIESDRQLSFEIEEHTDPFSLLKRIAKDFELELRFRVEHNGNRITGRFVDLLERVGEWRGREVTFGKDLDGIRRIENTERIVTALVGLGPEREDGTRLEVLVEDDEALQRWGRPDPVTGELRHLIEVYEPQSERQEMTLAELRQYTRTELNKRINAVVTYVCSIVDLENVPGMENKQIRFGDTIRIKDEKFNPPLYLEARVFEQERSIKSKGKKNIKLGDFIEFTEDEVKAIWRQLQREVKKRITAAELREYAEPKKIESDTPPPIKEGENPIWVKTDGDIKIPHVVIGNEWVKMTPTTAEEVDAYTKQQTDDIAEDASRLKTGIIDVNQVPLRTSITGARIEWDGINGLVQYDADGNPVSWLDLSGNAHFENGYFKGDIIGSAITGSSFHTESGSEGSIDIFEGWLRSTYETLAGPVWRATISKGEVTLTETPPQGGTPNVTTKITPFGVYAEGVFSKKGVNTSSLFVESFENTLWQGQAYPTASQTITPSKPLSNCTTGWLLKWQGYTAGTGVQNHNYQLTIIPKILVSTQEGLGMSHTLSRDGKLVHKYLYAHNDRIVGNDMNNDADRRVLALTGVYEF